MAADEDSGVLLAGTLQPDSVLRSARTEFGEGATTGTRTKERSGEESGRLGNLLKDLRLKREWNEKQRGAWSPVQLQLGTAPTWSEDAQSPSEKWRAASRHESPLAVKSKELQAVLDAQQLGSNESVQSGSTGSKAASQTGSSRLQYMSAYSTPRHGHNHSTSPLQLSQKRRAAYDKSSLEEGLVSLKITPRQSSPRPPWLTPPRQTPEEPSGKILRKKGTDSDSTKKGIYAPDLDSDSEEDSPCEPLLPHDVDVSGGGALEICFNAGGDPVVGESPGLWMRYEKEHLARVNHLVEAIRSNRAVAESELNAALLECEAAHQERKDEVTKDAPIRASEESTRVFNNWQAQKKARDNRRNDRISTQSAEKQRVREKEIERARREEQLAREQRKKQQEKEARDAAEKARLKAEQEQAKLKAEQESAKLKAKEQAKAAEKAKSAAKAKAKQTEHVALASFLADIESKAETFRTDASASKIRMELKKGVNRAINQIAASQKQVRLVSSNLRSILGKAQQVGAGAVAFTENLIAERLVAEGSGQVMLHQTSAFPIAAVAVILMGSYPELTKVLLARFQKTCPYTVPHYVHRSAGMSEQEYRVALGYADDETTDQYTERMCGYISLFAAILQTDGRVYGVQNPLGMSRAWGWLARMVNMKPRRITSTVIMTFLDIGGFEMHRYFRKQFGKLLRLLVTQFLPQLPEDSPPGAGARIGVFADEYFSGQIKQPEGKMLPARDAENVE